MLQKSGNTNLCKQKFQVKAYLGSETFDIFLRSLHTGNSQLATRRIANPGSGQYINIGMRRLLVQENSLGSGTFGTVFTTASRARRGASQRNSSVTRGQDINRH